MQVLVTGAAGYFGRQIVPALLADPRVTRVRAADLKATSASHPKLEGVAHDLTRDDPQSLLDGVDAVIHLAFQVERKPGDDPVDINVEAQARFLRAAVAIDGPLVVTSSVAAYGLREEPFDRLDEEAPVAPGRGFYYAEHKIAAERLLASLQPRARVIVARPSAVGGPTIDPKRGLAYKGQVRLLAGTPHPQRMQVLHELDLGPAYMALLDAPAGVYNVAPDDEILEADLARTLGQTPVTVPRWLYHKAADLTWRLGVNNLDAAWAGILDYPSVVVDNAKLRALGWQPTRTTVDALRDVMAAVRGGQP
jgi:nucleoside-diphosphate-sugar epimerase